METSEHVCKNRTQKSTVTSAVEAEVDRQKTGSGHHLVCGVRGGGRQDKAR